MQHANTIVGFGFVMTVKTTNPATEEVIAEYEIISKEKISESIKKSRAAFSEWKKDIKKRAAFVHTLADELRKNKTDLACVATKEMGKPIKEALSEVEKCAWAMEFYGDNGDIFLTPEIVTLTPERAFCHLNQLE